MYTDSGFVFAVCASRCFVSGRVSLFDFHQLKGESPWQQQAQQQILTALPPPHASRQPRTPRRQMRPLQSSLPRRYRIRLPQLAQSLRPRQKLQSSQSLNDLPSRPRHRPPRATPPQSSFRPRTHRRTRRRSSCHGQRRYSLRPRHHAHEQCGRMDRPALPCDHLPRRFRASAGFWSQIVATQLLSFRPEIQPDRASHLRTRAPRRNFPRGNRARRTTPRRCRPARRRKTARSGQTSRPSRDHHRTLTGIRCRLRRASTRSGGRQTGA